MGAHVRVQRTAKSGIVSGRVETPAGTRFLVRHRLSKKERLPRNGTRPSSDEELYDADELELLYAVRPGGQPENPPLLRPTAGTGSVDLVG
jgi:hypothetical protein